MPRFARPLALAFTLAMGLAACARREAEAPEVSIAMRVHPDPPTTGAVSIDLALTHRTGAPIAGAQVEIEGNMTHPGMVPSFATARETEPGSYRADLELSMAGDWVILVDARLASGERVQRSLPLCGVRAR